jgi:non-ribosomal peptide synthetase component F
VAERAALNSPAARDHWLRQAEPAREPAARHPGATVYATHHHDVTLGDDLVRDLLGTGRMLGASTKAVALAAHVGALAAWTGRDRDVVTGLVFNTRPTTPGSELTTGLFLNILPIRFPSVGGTWAALIQAAAEAERAGLDHQAYPQAKLVEQLGCPAFGVSFNFVSYHAYRELGDCVPATGRWRRGLTSFPFQVTLELADGHGELRVSSDPAIVPASAVAEYAQLLVQALITVSQNPLGSIRPAQEVAV